MRRWKRLKSEYVLQHPIVRLRKDACQLPRGTVIEDYYVVEEHDVGMVFALTADQRVILVEQYKHGIGEICLELPAGFFDERDGDPLAEARREFVEETGFDAREYFYAGSLVQNPTRMTSRIHLVLALNASHSGDQELDPSEDIAVKLIPLPAVMDMIRSGQVNAVGTVAGILLALDTLRRNGLVAI